jgi:SAM-dependent methyltransferase
MNTKMAVTVPEIVPKELWEQEFSVKHSIPSSTRQEPAKALVLFSEMLNLGKPMKVLDAGCGNGRNTIYLAKRGCEVTALDFADSAIRETQHRAMLAGVAERVSIVRHFMDDPTPFPSESFDFALDAYTFCHFLAKEVAQKFWEDMSRVVRPDGQLLSIVFSPEDEYYARLLMDSPDGSLVCDPSNGIWKRLYTESEIKSFFAARFEIRYFAKFEFADIVLGKSYQRVVLACVLRKPSK